MSGVISPEYRFEPTTGLMMVSFLSSVYTPPGCFEVFFPREDKFMLPLSVLCRVPPDGRMIAWWMTKRGIDYGRCRGVSTEDGQAVVRIALA